MPAKYTVHLGGRDRGLRFTLDDREALEGLFPRPDGTPCNLWELLQNHFMKPGSLAVQTAILWRALYSNDNRITMENVRKWLRQYLDGGGKPTPIFKTVWDAALESGVLGFTLKPEQYMGLEDEGEEGGSPKEKDIPPPS